MERTPEMRLEPPDYEEPRCPVCDAACETVFRDRHGDYVGCDVCLKQIDAWEWNTAQRALTA